MANQQLVDYIRNTLSQGYKEEDIIKHLLEYGYQQADAEEAMREAKAANPPSLSSGQQDSAQYPSAAASSSPSSGYSPSQTASIQSGFQGIKHRNPVLVIVFSLITFGIYYFYWLVSTTKELRKNTTSAPNPWLLLLLLVPFVNIVIFFLYLWKYSRAINELTGYETMTLFIIWILFSPVAMYLAQQELNTKAEQ